MTLQEFTLIAVGIKSFGLYDAKNDKIVTALSEASVAELVKFQYSVIDKIHIFADSDRKIRACIYLKDVVEIGVMEPQTFVPQEG